MYFKKDETVFVFMFMITIPAIMVNQQILAQEVTYKPHSP